MNWAQVINYLVQDERNMFELPTASFIQVAPNVRDVEEGNDAKLNDGILCNLPEEECIDETEIARRRPHGVRG